MSVFDAKLKDIERYEREGGRDRWMFEYCAFLLRELRAARSVLAHIQTSVQPHQLLSAKYFEESETRVAREAIAGAHDVFSNAAEALRMIHRNMIIMECVTRLNQKAESAAHVGADKASECYTECADDLRALFQTRLES